MPTWRVSSLSEFSKSVVIESVLTSSPSGPTPCERDAMDRYDSCQHRAGTDSVPLTVSLLVIVLTGSPGGPRGPRSPCNQTRTHQKHQKAGQQFYINTHIYMILFGRTFGPFSPVTPGSPGGPTGPCRDGQTQQSAHLQPFTQNV